MSIWNDVKSDLVAGVTSFSSSIAFGDTMNDDDFKLTCADFKTNKIKTFKQESLLSEQNLQYTPVGICSFYAPDPQTKTNQAYLAVAGGHYIFIYKNLKGTIKLLVPNIEVNSLEIQIWEDLKEGKIDNGTAVEKLKDMAKSKIQLSTRSLDLLSIKDELEVSTFITEKKSDPIQMINFIVCIATIRKYNSEALLTPSNIVVGTEGGNIFVIDSNGYKIISKFKLDSTPTFICTSGSYENDYRIHIACRNETIYTIKNGELQAEIIQIGSRVNGMIKYENSIYLSTVDRNYSSYSTNGRKNFSLKLPSQILVLEKCESGKRNFKGLLMALRNNEIRLYLERQLLSIITISEPIMGIKFGRLGKSEDILAIISEKGSLYLKSIDKSVILESSSYKKATASNDEGKLDIPKKTTLYVDLMEREKENFREMHEIFQSDLNRLKFKTLDTYTKLLIKGHAPQNYSTVSKVKLNVSIQGLGPMFKLLLTVDNSGEEVINSTDLIIDYDKDIYDFPKENIQLGVLMPHVPTKYSLKFKNISEGGSSGSLKIMVVDRNSAAPLITSKIKVPISELELF